jgi:hypothetical protein
MSELAAGAGQGVRGRHDGRGVPGAGAGRDGPEPAGQRVAVHLVQPVHQLRVDVLVVQVGPLVDLGGVLRRRPRGPAAQEVQEEACLDRLGQAGHRAGGHGLGAHLVGGVAGDDEEAGAGTVVAHPAEHRRAALPGHRHVGDDQVDLGDGGDAVGGGGVGGLADLPAAEAEETGGAAAGVGLVVDDQRGQHASTAVRAESAVQP